MTGTPRIRVLMAVACTFLHVPALMAVVPALAQATTGRPGDGGLVTAFSAAATVCAELTMPSLLGRVRPGRVFAIALLLLAGSALAHLWLTLSLTTILALAVIRGVGFGAAVVTGAVLVAELAPAHARARALGTMGLVVGLASTVSPSAGLLLLDGLGKAWVFALVGVIALLGSVVVEGVDRGLPPAHAPTVQVHRGLARPDLLVPVLGLALLTATYGGLVSFAPRILEPVGWGSAASFFFAFGATRSVTRWLGGRAADRFGARRVVLGGLVCACIGVSLLPLSTSTATVLIGGLLYGAGSGIAQTASFVGMLDQAGLGQVRLVGTLWNLAFDGGVSLGGVLLGVVADVGGYSSVLVGMPVLAFMALLLFGVAWRAPGPVQR
jgi:predicted MFS family arabinose efflux permease